MPDKQTDKYKDSEAEVPVFELRKCWIVLNDNESKTRAVTHIQSVTFLDNDTKDHKGFRKVPNMRVLVEKVLKKLTHIQSVTSLDTDRDDLSPFVASLQNKRVTIIFGHKLVPTHYTGREKTNKTAKKT